MLDRGKSVLDREITRFEQDAVPVGQLRPLSDREAEELLKLRQVPEPAPAPADGEGRQLEKLGAGRSAEVFLEVDADGRKVVRKIFLGEGAAKVVLFVLTGSANPYTWCQAAIRAAVARRYVLEPLVAWWFDGKLRLPRTDGWQWNEEHEAFEIHSELIEGTHAPLLGPQMQHPIDPVKDLVTTVMKPLQRHLAEAGFDGLVWQAGRGNPVAANNFMLETPVEEAEATEQLKWVWIDLESGVPALFAMNPLATLRFYLPKSLRHGNWLFDDVDVPKLRSYLGEHGEEIAAAAGEEALERALRYVSELESCQKEWKSLARHERGIEYELSRGRLSEEEAEHYRSRPVAWIARTARYAVRRGTAFLVDRTKRAVAWLLALRFLPLLAACGRFAVSQRYRSHLARVLVMKRVHSWGERKFLDQEESELLLSQLRRDDISSYVTDFGVHLMIKPAIKTFQYVVVPSLVAAGSLDLLTAGILMVVGGMLGRTVYTTGRLVQAAARGQRKPWIALALGSLPVVGNLAYPTQLVHCSTEETGEVARFMFYDSLAAIGRAVPVWGGADSLVEHFFNRLGDLAVHVLGKRIA